MEKGEPEKPGNKEDGGSMFLCSVFSDRGGVRAFPAPCGFMYLVLPYLLHFHSPSSNMES